MSDTGLLVVGAATFVMLILMVESKMDGKPEKESVEEKTIRERKKELIQDAYWENYAQGLDSWVKKNKGVRPPAKLNWSQLKILVTLAQHYEFHERPSRNRLLTVWGWDGSRTDRLKFDRDLERLEEKRFVLEDVNDNWGLKDADRDMLIDSKFI